MAGDYATRRRAVRPGDGGTMRSASTAIDMLILCRKTGVSRCTQGTAVPQGMMVRLIPAKPD